MEIDTGGNSDKSLAPTEIVDSDDEVQSWMRPYPRMAIMIDQQLAIERARCAALTAHRAAYREVLNEVNPPHSDPDDFNPFEHRGLQDEDDMAEARSAWGAFNLCLDEAMRDNLVVHSEVLARHQGKQRDNKPVEANKEEVLRVRIQKVSCSPKFTMQQACLTYC